MYMYFYMSLTSTSKNLTSLLYFAIRTCSPKINTCNCSNILWITHRLSWHHWHFLCNVYLSTFKWHMYVRTISNSLQYFSFQISFECSQTGRTCLAKCLTKKKSQSLSSNFLNEKLQHPEFFKTCCSNMQVIHFIHKTVW